jgi:hypothetical protein
MFYFQVLGSRRFQRGSDRVNLHRPTQRQVQLASEALAAIEEQVLDEAAV